MEAGSKPSLAEERELDRIRAFSDGVFAVAITLLVLNIEVPDVAAGDLAGALDDLIPDVQAYFIAFAVIGLFWFGHHRSWSRYRGTTAGLVWANLLLLSLIALMPFTTALMGRYDDEAISVVLYACNVGLASLADSFVDKVAFDQGLAEPVDAREHRAEVVTGWLRPAIFILSIPLAFVSVLLAQLLWLTLLLLPWVGRRVARPGSTTDRSP
ncbi:MAG: TMEM175 family protein [Solirubrobacterales bacterium]